MPRPIRSFRILSLGALVLLAPAEPLPAVEPGVDIAVPRVAITTVDGSSLVFHPARLVIEQGDHVRWSPTTASIHNTTSGPPCTANGLWNQSLGTAGVNFTRQFPEPPQVFPFFCNPHCSLGMTGQVVVTTLIGMTMTHSSGVPALSWSGGGGSYQIFRSDRPVFTGPGTVRLAPDGGSTGTTFTDSLAPQPPVGGASFYLVMNLF